MLGSAEQVSGKDPGSYLQPPLVRPPLGSTGENLAVSVSIGKILHPRAPLSPATTADDDTMCSTEAGPSKDMTLDTGTQDPTSIHLGKEEGEGTPLLT